MSKRARSRIIIDLFKNVDTALNVVDRRAIVTGEDLDM